MRIVVLLIGSLLSSQKAHAEAPRLHLIEGGVLLGAMPGSLALQTTTGFGLRTSLDFSRNVGLAVQLDAGTSHSSTSVYQSTSWWLKPSVLAEFQIGRQKTKIRTGLGITTDFRPGSFKVNDQQWASSAMGIGGLTRISLEFPIHKSLYGTLATNIYWTNLGLSQSAIASIGWKP